LWGRLREDIRGGEEHGITVLDGRTPPDIIIHVGRGRDREEGKMERT